MLVSLLKPDRLVQVKVTEFVLPQFGVWIREELVLSESVRHKVRLEPLLLGFVSVQVYLILRDGWGLGLLLESVEVVSKAVIGDDKSIKPPRILNTVAVVIVLSWRSNKHSFLFQVAKHPDIIRAFLRLDLRTKLLLRLQGIDLLIV